MNHDQGLGLVTILHFPPLQRSQAERDQGDGSGWAEQAASRLQKAQGESNVKANPKGKIKGKGGLSLDRCGWCDTEGANKTCTQCRSVVYCSPACQKVSRT